MSGSIKLKHASGNGVIISAPSSNPAADRTLTLPSDADGVIAKTDSSGNLTVAGDLNTSNINGGQISNRNLIINGAMNIAQRGTSSTSSSYATLDRFRLAVANTDQAAYTQKQVSDSPDDFSQSYEFDVTTAETSLDSNEYAFIGHRIEAQNLQRVKANQVTLSFYVKAYQTGTYVINIYQSDGNIQITKTYTISQSGTWEKKTLTFAANTGTQPNNDNGLGWEIAWVMAAGSGVTSSDSTSWGTYSDAGFAFGQGVNVLSSTDNYFKITGVQLEVGSVATDFEHRSFGQELALCKRYFQTSFTSNPSTTNTDNSGLVLFGGGRTGDSTSFLGGSYVQLSPAMRSAPTVTTFDVATPRNTNKCHRHTYGFTGSNDQPVTLTDVNINSFVVRSDSGNSANGIIYHWKCEAEL